MEQLRPSNALSRDAIDLYELFKHAILRYDRVASYPRSPSLGVMIFRKHNSTERVPWEPGKMGVICNTVDRLLTERYLPIGFEVLPNDEFVVFNELRPRDLKDEAKPLLEDYKSNGQRSFDFEHTDVHYVVTASVPVSQKMANLTFESVRA